jgi:transglutaminase-like putative cysteine protease
MMWRSDPLGLSVVRQRTSRVRRRFLVHPLPLSPAGGRLAFGTEGEPSAALKPFEDGDELRRVHWTTSERLGHWMVQMPDTSLRATTAVLVDLRPAVHTPDSFERTIGLAAGLVQPRQGGGPTRLVTTAGLDSGPLATSARFSEVLAALASERPRPGPPPEALIERLPALRRCERVIIVTTPAGCPVTARPRQRTEYVVAEGPAQLRSNPARLGGLADGTDPRSLLQPVPLRSPPPLPPVAAGAIGVIGRLIASGVAIAALGLLFMGDGWVVPLVAAALAGHGMPFLTDAGARLLSRRGSRRVRPSVTLGVLGGVVGTAVIAGLVANGGHPGHPPIINDFAPLGRALWRLPVNLRLTGVLAPERIPLVVGSTVAVGLAATLAEFLTRRGKGVWAAVPASLVVVFGATEGVGHLSVTTCGVLAASMVLAIGLLAGGSREIIQVSRQQQTGGGGGTSSSVRLGYPRDRRLHWIRVAAAVTFFGACLALAGWLGNLAVSATGGGLVSLRTAGPGGLVHIDPTVSFAPQLSETGGPVLFTVRSPVPDYWQLLTLDVLGPAGFVSASSAFTPFASGPQPMPNGRRVVEVFHLVGLASPWLPVGGIPLSISGISGLDWAPESETLFVPDQEPAAPGATYAIDALQPMPSAAALAGATLVADPPPVDVGVPTEPDRVVRLAHQVVAGLTTPFAKAVAIQNYLRAHETYNLNPPTGPGNQLERFLFVTHAGYCQQFSAAFALMARIDGLPTRVAVGTTPGQLVQGDTYQVTPADIHSWPEVLFAGLGWVRFEPTPGRGPPGNTNYTGILPSQVGAAGGTSVAPVGVPTHSSGNSPDPSAPHGEATLPGLVPLPIGVTPTTAPSPARVPPGSSRAPEPGTSVDFVVWGAVGAALLLVLLFLVAGRFRRRVARAVIGGIRGPKGAGREGGVPYELLRAWEQACATVGPLIGERRSAETANAYARRCQGRVPLETARQLDALATALGRAFFGPPPVSAVVR